MSNIFQNVKKWWKRTLQRERDFYYDTHGPYKNRKEKKTIESCTKNHK